jgi:hypothetical protein
MNTRIILAATAVAVIASCAVLPKQSMAATRDKVLWDKKANFNVSQFHMQKHKTEPPPNKVEDLQSPAILGPPKIIDTFQLEGDTTLTTATTAPVAISIPRPTRCDWAKSIVAAYAFENVIPKTCNLGVLRFEATRQGRKFSIQVSAVNGDLIKVERIDTNEEAGGF